MVDMVFGTEQKLSLTPENYLFRVSYFIVLFTILFIYYNIKDNWSEKGIDVDIC